jgi:hypothetical protein
MVAAPVHFFVPLLRRRSCSMVMTAQKLAEGGVAAIALPGVLWA